MSRQQQDEHAARSHQRAAAAWAAGKFDSQVVPVDTVWKDPKTVSDTRHMQFEVVGMASTQRKMLKQEFLHNILAKSGGVLKCETLARPVALVLLAPFCIGSDVCLVRSRVSCSICA